MNEVWVSTQHAKTVFEQTKYEKKDDKGALVEIVELKKPVKVIFEGADLNKYKILDNPSTTINLDSVKEPFAFLFVGHWIGDGPIGEDRKNITGLIHCFFNTFKNKKDQPALILKTSGATYSIMDRLELEDKITQIRDMFAKEKLPNVYLVHGELTDHEMNALYNHAKIKAMVSFTKAEGFGRPLLEFSTTGKPIIAPHYSGQADFLKKDFICAIPGQVTPIHGSAQNEFLIADAKWFSVDYGHASNLLTDMITNYKKWQELAKRQRYFVNTTFTRTAVAKTYETVLSIVDEGVNKIPKAVELKLPTLNKIQLPRLQKI
jgi:glycosyltransferase involved in cell wall biosynthesis